MTALDLRTVARLLGGDVQRNGALVPGPGHNPRDRSLSITLSPTAPGGFVVFSHAGDDHLACKDHVREKLGLRREVRRLSAPPPLRPKVSQVEPPSEEAARKRRIVVLWSEARDPCNTPVDTFWRSRGLVLDDNVVGIIRFLANCPWRGDDGQVRQVPAMLAAMRNIHTDELTAVHRTALTLDGKKLGRRMLGITAGAAAKLDADANVHEGLVIGEGLETVQAARQLGLRPAWALGSAGAIATFPVLNGIEALTILAERNEDGSANAASYRAIEECGTRWHQAGREVIVIEPPAGDVNDALVASRRAA